MVDSILERTVLRDAALNDLVSFVHGLGTADSRKVLKKWVDNGVIHASAIVNDVSVSTPLGAAVGFLLGDESGVGDIPPVAWENLMPGRTFIVKLITDNAERFVQAVEKPSLRGWFVSKAMTGRHQGFNDARILTLAFKAAEHMT